MLNTPAKPPSGASQSGIQCFKLTYESLEGYGNLLGRKLEVNCFSFLTELLIATPAGELSEQVIVVNGDVWLYQLLIYK